MNNAEIGSKIRIYRKIKGVSQEQLAKLTGISAKNLSQYEAGKQTIGKEALFRVCSALQVPMSELLGAPAHSDELTYYLALLAQAQRDGKDPETIMGLTAKVMEVYNTAGSADETAEQLLLRRFHSLNAMNQAKLLEYAGLLASAPSNDLNEKS